MVDNSSTSYQGGISVYDLPFTKQLKKFRIFQYIPFLPCFRESICCRCCKKDTLKGDGNLDEYYENGKLPNGDELHEIWLLTDSNTCSIGTNLIVIPLALLGPNKLCTPITTRSFLGWVVFSKLFFQFSTISLLNCKYSTRSTNVMDWYNKNWRKKCNPDATALF